MLELFAKAVREPFFWGAVAQAVVGWVTPFAVQKLLLRQMSEERRARSWNELTWAVGILFFNAMTMIPFAWVTRRRRGVGHGVLALARGLLLFVLVVVLQLALNGVINVALMGRRFLEL